MKTTQHYFKGYLIFILFISCILTSFAQTTLQGKVIDSNGKTALPGANINIQGSKEGTTTDVDGSFKLNSSKSFPITLTVSFTGFNSKTIIAKSNSDLAAIELTEEGQNLQEVVVTASKRVEKVQESPAAVSILKSAAIMNDLSSSPISSLRNLPGVDIAQYGVTEGQINLRGKGNAFGSETFVIADYRNVVMPSFGTVQYSQMPIPSIDIDRIEIVKGTAGALYGPGVEAGVVHYMSKSAFKEQGTTIQIGGGNQDQMQASFRFANVTGNGKFGYKLTGGWKQAHDFPLNTNDPAQAARLATYKRPIISSITGLPVDIPVGTLFNRAFNLNADLEYRFSEKTSLVTVLGATKAKSPFRGNQGEGYADLFRPFAQVRFKSGGFFSQAFWSHQYGGDGTAALYGGGKTLIQEIDQIEGQAQYDFDLGKKLSFTSGADYRYNAIDTKGTVHGRYEDLDTYTILGFYTQAKYQPSEKFDLIGALRYDYFNVLEKGAFSPRVGIVYKANSDNTFRMTYNKSYGMPSALSYFADFANTATANFDVWLNGGNTNLTYDNGTSYSFITKTPLPTINLPMKAAYGAATAGLIAAGATGAGGPLAGLAPYLGSLTSFITGALSGSFVKSPSATLNTPLATIERTKKLQLSSSEMIEFGYKGRLTNKLSVTTDFYINRRSNMVSNPILTSPFVGYAAAGAEITLAVKNAIAAQGNPLNLTPLQIAKIAGAYALAIQKNTKNADGSTAALAIATSDQTANGHTVDLTYYNIKQLEYLGLDTSFDYAFTNDLSANFNFSWVSNNYFKDQELVGTSVRQDVALNAPDKRYKLGLDYSPKTGFSAKAALRHTPQWRSLSGVFSGIVEESTVVDAGFGYGFANGLKFNFNMTNVFDTKYQAIANSTEIGRLFLGTLTYKFK